MAARSPAVPRNSRDRPSAARTGHARTSGHRRGPRPPCPIRQEPPGPSHLPDRARNPVHQDHGQQWPPAAHSRPKRQQPEERADETSATANGPPGHSPEPKRRNQPAPETNHSAAPKPTVGWIQGQVRRIHQLASMRGWFHDHTRNQPGRETNQPPPLASNSTARTRATHPTDHRAEPTHTAAPRAPAPSGIPHAPEVPTTRIRSPNPPAPTPCKIHIFKQ